jgi:hypothetical protein
LFSNIIGFTTLDDFGYLGHRRRYASSMDDLSLRLSMAKFLKFFGDSERVFVRYLASTSLVQKAR